MADGYVHDAFLTHDWGEDGSNHRKVKAIYDMLKEHGVNSWFDEEVRARLEPAAAWQRRAILCWFRLTSYEASVRMLGR